MTDNNIGKSVYGAPHMSRDLVGYGQHPPNPKWPNGAKVALQVSNLHIIRSALFLV
jgi:hypothetical protein